MVKIRNDRSGPCKDPALTDYAVEHNVTSLWTRCKNCGWVLAHHKD